MRSFVQNPCRVVTRSNAPRIELSNPKTTPLPRQDLPSTLEKKLSAFYNRLPRAKQRDQSKLTYMKISFLLPRRSLARPVLQAHRPAIERVRQSGDHQCFPRSPKTLCGAVSSLLRLHCDADSLQRRQRFRPTTHSSEVTRATTLSCPPVCSTRVADLKGKWVFTPLNG